VPVQADLSVAGFPTVSVIGDLAAATSQGRPVPGVSPAAKQMGRCAAANIVARLRGQPTQTFVYTDYGSLATLGRMAAVVQLPLPGGRTLRFSGYPAWLFWLFAHVVFLIGFRNRLVVLIDWAWSYWTFARHARVVAQPEARPPPGPQT
jgi:NADH:ubiquinone reductase (H+-translocating)